LGEPEIWGSPPSSRGRTSPFQGEKNGSSPFGGGRGRLMASRGAHDPNDAGSNPAPDLLLGFGIII
jgi:hypothetical protein